MADGVVGEDILMLVLGHELWCQVLPHFSPRAVVTGFSAAWLTVPHNFHESVQTFVWPIPTTGSSVTVEEPDSVAFVARIREAGVRLPDLEEIPQALELLEQFEDDPEITDPGSYVLSKVCLNCSKEDLWIEGGAVAVDVVDSYVADHGLDEGAKKHLLVLRCASCLEVHVDGPNGMVTYSLCQA